MHAFVCSECERVLPPPADPAETPRNSTRVRLVRRADGTEEEWGTDGKTLAPSALVHDQCLNVPRHGPAVVTSAKNFSHGLAQMPRGEAVYGWPYYASRYLVSESLLKKHMLKTWNALREVRETQQRVEQRLTWIQRFLKLFQWRRT